MSRIEREYEASDQRRYFVPCPHCGAMQWLQFERLRWEKGKPETAEYHCEGSDAIGANETKSGPSFSAKTKAGVCRWPGPFSFSARE